jgi:hypothetical protein
VSVTIRALVMTGFSTAGGCRSFVIAAVATATALVAVFVNSGVPA